VERWIIPQILTHSHDELSKSTRKMGAFIQALRNWSYFNNALFTYIIYMENIKEISQEKDFLNHYIIVYKD